MLELGTTPRNPIQGLPPWQSMPLGMPRVVDLNIPRLFISICGRIEWFPLPGLVTLKSKSIWFWTRNKVMIDNRQYMLLLIISSCSLVKSFLFDRSDWKCDIQIKSTSDGFREPHHVFSRIRAWLNMYQHHVRKNMEQVWKYHGKNMKHTEIASSEALWF